MFTFDCASVIIFASHMTFGIQKTLEKLESGRAVCIVAFGDSITEGYEVSSGFVDIFRVDLRRKFPESELNVINSGRCGDTTFDAVERFRRDVAAHDPDLVTVQFGLNDCFGCVYRSEFRENMGWILKRLREETHAEVVLMTSVMPMGAGDADAVVRYYDVIRDFAREERTALVQLDVLWKEAARDPRMFHRLTMPDGVHPTEHGHRFIADALMAVFTLEGTDARCAVPYGTENRE